MVIREALLTTMLMMYFTNISRSLHNLLSQFLRCNPCFTLFRSPYSDAITRRLKSWVNKFYGFVNLRVVFQNTRRIKSFFPYKDRFNWSQKSNIVYKASCWDCEAFYIGKTKRLRDRKTEHFIALTQIGHASAVAEHSISTGHNIKWDHFEILANGQCDLQGKIKETLSIQDLKPALNENVGSENLLLY